MFSIIIPVKSINDYIRETVPHIQQLTGPEWELFIIPNEDEPTEWSEDGRIKVFSSGIVGPAAKRDIGAERASGEILVFLDDDSYPNKNLLEIALQYFKDQSIVALGGPAITPPDDTFWQRVSGAVFLSKFSGGAPERYIPVGKPRPVQDWPSVNLMVRKQEFLETGGFNSPYWPGEDTKFCLDLLEMTNKIIIYAPDLYVWHHRRGAFVEHLNQIGGYGLHRGYFAKKYPKTSRKLKYFLPSLLSIFFLFSFFASTFPPQLQYLVLIGWMIYALVLIKACIDIARWESLPVALVATIYIIPTHIIYGIQFIRGILKKQLISSLR